MAEVKNNFIKSKMNKDLDDRLVPAGEYRNAQNIAIAKSEGPNVGALENILGNNLISSFTLPTDTYGVEIIGHFMDVKNDRIIVLMTNYVDISSDSLSNFSPTDAYHAIGVYNLKALVSSIIVSGRFLNFSKTHEIYGINVIDDLLFWTDNRNQPRKINLLRANPGNLTTPTYYTTEDTISVSKYYPYTPIDLIRNLVVGLGMGLPIPGSGYTTTTNVATSGGTGTGLTLNLSLGGGGGVNIAWVNNPGIGYTNGDVVNIIEPWPGGGGGASVQVVTELASTMTDVVSDYLPWIYCDPAGDPGTKNPYRQPYATNAFMTPPTPPLTWAGNPEYLKDKFVRFSYRFKFDDDEYSLIAPFTQTCFVPLKDGYFMEPAGVGEPGQFDQDDVVNTYKSTEVDLMQNKINNIELIINSPLGNWNTVEDTMKIKEVDILYKEAGQNTIKVIATLNKDELGLVNSTFLTYQYKSTKPWKTLPDKEVLRVHDQVPVRALAQEVAENRVIYGNYIDKPTSPSFLNYSCNISEKPQDTQIEYQNQNLKQNRTYQVGVVLSDRYGRQSTVILSTLDDGAFSDEIKGSTLFHKYKESPFSEQDGSGNLFTSSVFPSTPGDIWDGDNLEMTFWNSISSTKNSITGEPGLYDATTNPLGWYSYKIVVKQQEQDYYNIYFPGILNGYIDGEAISTPASLTEPICHMALYADNINKVPRDLSLVGPNQTTFRTSRPSFQEDPTYYRFNGQLIDPLSQEGEKLLKERDRAKDLDSGSQITNASVKLSLRLNNGLGYSLLDPKYTSTYQAYPGSKEDIVTTIGTGSELGLWDPSAIAPFNTANVFYGYKNNPYIAKMKVSEPTTTGLKGPHPYSGVLKFVLQSTVAGTGYIAGSKNVPCTIPTTAGFTISGFKVNIPVTTITAKDLEIANIGTGWPSVVTAPFSIPDCTISGAGGSDSEFTIYVTSDNSNGEMAPSLAVYETEPLKSELDIYWETSTNGLINELNDAINSGDITTPIEILPDVAYPVRSDAFGNKWYYWQDEGLASGSYITSPMYVTNSVGNPLPTTPSSVVTYTLLSVYDGNLTNRTSEFTLENSPVGFPDHFKLKTNDTFAVNSNNNIVGSFTFNINVNTAGASYPIDGVTIDRTLTLGPSGGLVTPIVNITPQVVPVTPWSYVVSAFPGTPLFTLQGYNGSVIGGGKEFEDLTWEMVRYSGGTPIPVPELYFVPVGLNTGLVELWLNSTATSAMDSSNPGIGDYYPRLVDGGGLDWGGLYFSLTVN